MSNVKCQMLIYNSLTSKKETFVKPRGRALNLFVCGPTVYDLSHIGHAKTYVSFDVIVRYLRARGWKVFYLQNITDVDDKIIARAQKEKKLPQELARHFEKEYHQDMKVLGVDTVDKYARATEFISAIQKQITTLVEKGFAYKIGSGVYFEVKKFKNYGRLSRQNLNQLRDGWRIEPDPQKRDPLDFALWKISDKEPFWPSLWGSGRPGWHIEDTAITEAFFGPQYDLHGGGLDLKFPHHESEIAQQEAASGKSPFVKIWLHTGFLLVNGEKMSKSVGNVIGIRDILQKTTPAVLRFLITGGHYRSPLNYSEALLEQAQNSVNNVIRFLSKLDLIKSNPKISHEVQLRGNPTKLNFVGSKEDFLNAMDDDFNTPKALASIFSLMGAVEKNIWSLSQKQAVQLKKFVKKQFSILGIEVDSLSAPENIKDLVEQREVFRQKKNFAAADQLRRHAQKLGYEIEDTPAGPLISKI